MSHLRSRAAGSLALATALVSLLAVPAQAAWPGRPGPVVFAAVSPAPKPSENVPAGLWRFTPGEGSTLTQLTTETSDRDPQVSPDGRLVVFSRVVRTVFSRRISGIFVMAIDGSGLRQLTDGGPRDGSDVQPSFDATGTRVVFVRTGEPDRRGDVYSIGLDGSGLTPLTSGPADDYMPAVSPRGRQIVFVRVHYPPGLPQGDEPHIYSIRPDGSHPRDLTPRLRSERAPWDPDFSPSGRLIAFATDGNTLRGDIFTMRASGGPIRRLTNRPRRRNPTFPRPYGYTNPAFSPAGGSILVVARSGTSPRLARIRLANPDRPQLLAPGFVGTAPAWAPAPGR